MARVSALFLYDAEGSAPRPVNSARSSTSGALEGDRHTRDERKILVVEKSNLDELGLTPGALREQITVEGIGGLDDLPKGTTIAIGDAVLEVTKPCAPCLTIGEYNGVSDREAFRDSLEGRRGIFVRFVRAGAISVGDEVSIKQAAPASG